MSGADAWGADAWGAGAWGAGAWRAGSTGFALIIVATLAVGCGAKTGLDVPDAQVDAGVDAGPDAQIPCIELPPDGGIIELPLETEVQLGRADVVFAIDTTASMTAEITEIQRTVRNQIVPGIEAAIPDSQIGVTTFADFPEGACGRPSEDDLPFRLLLPVTDDIGRVQVALNSIDVRNLNNGGDEPESQVEGLYQIATGEGVGRWVPASFGCPTGGFGYPCFRSDALPVVLLISDAPFHNGPGGAEAYSSPGACSVVEPAAHDFDEAATALTANGVRVIGLYAGEGGERSPGFTHLEEIATVTGAVGPEGPLAYDIDEEDRGLTASVIEAITTLAEVIVLDIDTLLLDVDRRDAVDPREFVEAVIPVRAEPMEGVREIDVEAGVFRGVRTGTTVVFQLALRNDVVAPGVGPQRFLLEVIFRGDGRTRLGSVIVEIVVPGADGTGCEMTNDPVPG